jgi:hypothetical protein
MAYAMAPLAIGAGVGGLAGLAGYANEKKQLAGRRKFEKTKMKHLGQGEYLLEPDIWSNMLMGAGAGLGYGGMVSGLMGDTEPMERTGQDPFIENAVADPNASTHVNSGTDFNVDYSSRPGQESMLGSFEGAPARYASGPLAVNAAPPPNFSVEGAQTNPYDMDMMRSMQGAPAQLQSPYENMMFNPNDQLRSGMFTPQQNPPPGMFADGYHQAQPRPPMFPGGY